MVGGWWLVDGGWWLVVGSRLLFCSCGGDCCNLFTMSGVVSVVRCSGNTPVYSCIVARQNKGHRVISCSPLLIYIGIYQKGVRLGKANCRSGAQHFGFPHGIWIGGCWKIGCYRPSRAGMRWIGVY
jgi:hypothetical protein